MPTHPFNPHDRFFSSLNQVEKRVASEKREEKSTQNPTFSSPLFLLSSPPPPPPPPPLLDSSGPPLDFLSNSTPPPKHQEIQEEKQEEDPLEDANEIERLMELLGLSDDGISSFSGCDCSGRDGFYSNIAGMKGPKCKKELERLDGWIELYFREKREPARLAHLLVGKAVGLRGDGGFGEVGFPSTVEEFLENDPPPPEEEEEEKKNEGV